MKYFNLARRLIRHGVGFLYENLAGPKGPKGFMMLFIGIHGDGKGMILNPLFGPARNGDKNKPSLKQTAKCPLKINVIGR